MRNQIRIRLARHGVRSRPVYHIVAIAAGKARNALPLEKLGEYDPIPVVQNTNEIPEASRIFGVKDTEALRQANESQRREKTVVWDLNRIGWWITKGAEPTQRVRKLLRTAGVIDSLSWSNRGAERVRAQFAEQVEVRSAPDKKTRRERERAEKGESEGKILQGRFDQALGKLQAQREADPVWQSGREERAKKASPSTKQADTKAAVRTKKPRTADKANTKSTKATTKSRR